MIRRALGILFLLPAMAAGQDLSIEASVDKNMVQLTDQIVLSVTVSGNQTDIPDPQLPSMPNFTIYSSGRSQNLSIINGRTSSSIAYNYVLVPRFPGKVQIGPVTVETGGRKYSTSPIDIQITREPQAPAPSQARSPSAPAQNRTPPANAGAQADAEGLAHAVQVTASLDKPKAYVNEQVILTVRFYTAVPLLGNPQYMPPSTQGFLSEDLPPERHGEVQNRGRLFHFSEIKTALFPAQAGRLNVGAAKVLVQVQSESGMDPFAADFFQKFFAQGLLSAQTRELKTPPVPLHVLPLPESGKPDAFNGAVGQFRVTADVDKRKLKVGEAVTLSLAIEGKGNLKALASPKLPEMPSLRTYDTLSSMNLNKANDVVQGSKTFKTVLVPRASGKLTIPPIPLSFFNPANGQYVIAKTSPINLEVETAGTSPASGFVAPSQSGPPDLTTLTQDIRYIQETARVSWPSRVLSSIGRKGRPHLLPLFVFLLSLGLSMYRERRSMDPAGSRFYAALSVARKNLKEARSLTESQSSHATELLSDALTGYLADKLDVSAHGLMLKETQTLLRARFPKIAEDRLIRLKSLWEDIEQMRFAGSGMADRARTDALVADLETFLRSMERELRR